MKTGARSAEPTAIASGEVDCPPRRSTWWKAVVAAEVALAAVVIVADLPVATLVVLAIALISMAARHEHARTVGMFRPPSLVKMAGVVLAAVVGWTALQLAVFMPVLEHLSGSTQDLSMFDGLEGDAAMLAGLLVLTWTLAAVGEEFVYRGYLPTRIGALAGERRGAVIAVLASSVLFGLAHTEQGIIGVGLTFLDACFFSLLKARFGGNLWAAVLAHGFSNTIGLVAFFLVGPIHGLW